LDFKNSMRNQSGLGSEITDSLHIYREVNEHSQDEIVGFADVLKRISQDFEIANTGFDKVNILKPEELAYAIACSKPDCSINSSSRLTYQDEIMMSLRNRSSILEPITPEVRQKDGITKLSIFPVKEIVHVTLDITDKIIYEERIATAAIIKQLTGGQLTLKPRRIWLGTARSMAIKYCGFKDEAEDILNSNQFDLKNIKLKPTDVIYDIPVRIGPKDISRFAFEQRTHGYK